MAYRDPASDVALLRAGILPRRGMGSISADDALANFLSVGQNVAAPTSYYAPGFDSGAYSMAVQQRLASPDDPEAPIIGPDGYTRSRYAEPPIEGVVGVPSWGSSASEPPIEGIVGVPSWGSSAAPAASPQSGISPADAAIASGNYGAPSPAPYRAPASQAAGAVGNLAGGAAGGILGGIAAIGNAIGGIGSAVPGIAAAFGFNEAAEAQQKLAQQQLQAQRDLALLNARTVADRTAQWTDTVEKVAPWVAGAIGLAGVAWAIKGAIGGKAGARRKNPPSIFGPVVRAMQSPWASLALAASSGYVGYTLTSQPSEKLKWAALLAAPWIVTAYFEFDEAKSRAKSPCYRRQRGWAPPRRRSR